MNIKEMNYDQRKELQNALTIVNKAERREIMQQKAMAKEKAVMVEIEKIRDFIDGLKINHNYPDDTLEVLSIHSHVNMVLEDRYIDAIRKIKQGFSIIKDIKRETAKFADDNKLPYSNLFKTTNRRMEKHIAREQTRNKPYNYKPPIYSIPGDELKKAEDFINSL